MILPALTEATSPLFRPIKYSLFPPLGLATLAAYLGPDVEVTIHDEHVERLRLDDEPDLVVIQVYITSARRSYEIADHYRRRGVYVVIGGLHPTSLPEEAAAHADTVFIGPGEDTWPRFLDDLPPGGRRRGTPRPCGRWWACRRSGATSSSATCTWCRTRSWCPEAAPTPATSVTRRPSSRAAGRSTPRPSTTPWPRSTACRAVTSTSSTTTSSATAVRPGAVRRHAGMGRLWQAAGTVKSVLQPGLLEAAVDAGLRSLFVGFETISQANLIEHRKNQNLNQDYDAAIRRLHDLGVMVNASFVFGMDDDDLTVFDRTVDWAVSQGIETATFHILTPYPSTGLYQRMEAEGRLLHRDWDRYDTRHAVFRPARMTPEQLEEGYWRAYRDFYRWRNIARGAAAHDDWTGGLRHVAYSGGLEEVRAGVGRPHPRPPGRPRPAGAGGGAVRPGAGPGRRRRSPRSNR